MELSQEWLRLPTEVELCHIMEVYTLLGLPGCIGSFDVVHIPWGMCPWGDRHLFTGFIIA